MWENFARSDALSRHFRTETGWLCIRPLMEEAKRLEEEEQQRQQQAQQQQQVPQQSQVSEQIGVNVEKSNLMMNIMIILILLKIITI